MSGEGNSRVAITVPPAQQALAEAVAATGTPVVVLLRHGRALALEGAVREAGAILACWFLGEATGDAVADIVVGRVAPGGRLPVSFPRATGQEPWSYDRLPTGRPAPDAAPMEPGRAHWRDVPDRPLYGFGHGLTYTRFALHDATLTRVPGAAAVALTVRNATARGGTAVLQLYVHDRVASRSQPLRRLVGIARLDVPGGGSVRTTMAVPIAELAIVAADGRWRVEPGAFDLIVAQSSDDPGILLRLDVDAAAAAELA
jgi:beta-glucosidase